MAQFKTQEEKDILLNDAFGIGKKPETFVGEELVTTYVPARMYKKQKQAFRDIIEAVAKEWGYTCQIEGGPLAKNCVIGDPENAKVVVGAHYDTPPRMPACLINHQFESFVLGVPAVVMAFGAGIPQMLIDLTVSGVRIPNLVECVKASQAMSYILPAGLIAYMEGLLGGANKKNFNDNSSGVLGVLSLMYRFKDLPQKEKDKIVFVLFDNEEKGLFGSLAYRQKHGKAIKKQHMVNLDCLNGETVNIYTAGNSAKFVMGLKDSLIGTGVKLNRKDFKLWNLFRMSDHYSFAGAQSVTGIINDVKNVHSSLDNKIDREHLFHTINGIAEGVERLSGIKLNEYTLKRVESFSADKLSDAYLRLIRKRNECEAEILLLESEVESIISNPMMSTVMTDEQLNRKIERARDARDEANKKLGAIKEDMELIKTTIEKQGMEVPMELITFDD